MWPNFLFLGRDRLINSNITLFHKYHKISHFIAKITIDSNYSIGKGIFLKKWKFCNFLKYHSSNKLVTLLCNALSEDKPCLSGERKNIIRHSNGQSSLFLKRAKSDHRQAVLKGKKQTSGPWEISFDFLKLKQKGLSLLKLWKKIKKSHQQRAQKAIRGIWLLLTIIPCTK